MTEDGAIGYSNGLVYSNQADMQHFRSFTKDHAVIMGSSTARSLNGPLKGRVNIVISKRLKADELGPDFHVFNTPAAALTYALQLDRPVTVVGGEAIYDLFLGVADRLVLTHFAHSVARADRWFPSMTGMRYVAVAKVQLAPDTTVVYSRLSET